MVRKFTKWDVLFPFLSDYQRSMILADFEKELEKPHQTLKRYVDGLVEEKILKKERREKHTSYRLNLENHFTPAYLSMSEKVSAMDFLQENRVMNRLYERLTPFFPEQFVLLFGSYAVGREGNDIDLFVLGEENDELREKLREFGSTYYRVHLTEVERKEELSRNFIKELHKKHIIFNGSDYFVRLFGELYGGIGMV